MVPDGSDPRRAVRPWNYGFAIATIGPEAHLVVTAPIRWRVDRVEHVDTLEVDPATKVGDQLDIWVDSSGNQVAAPAPTWRAGIDALFAGVASWLGLMAGVAGLSALVRAGLTRRRQMGWNRELRTLVDDGGGRTGSQT